MRKLNELQENTERQFTEIRKNNHIQKKKMRTLSRRNHKKELNSGAKEVMNEMGKNAIEKNLLFDLFCY